MEAGSKSEHIRLELTVKSIGILLQSQNITQRAGERHDNW